MPPLEPPVAKTASVLMHSSSSTCSHKRPVKSRPISHKQWQIACEIYRCQQLLEEVEVLEAGRPAAVRALAVIGTLAELPAGLVAAGGGGTERAPGLACAGLRQPRGANVPPRRAVRGDVIVHPLPGDRDEPLTSSTFFTVRNAQNWKISGEWAIQRCNWHTSRSPIFVYGGISPFASPLWPWM